MTVCDNANMCIAEHRSAAAYQLRKLLGQGGHGEIWEATQVSLDRLVAIKQISDRIYKSKDQPMIAAIEAAFKREALLNARLDHPSIVPVHDFGIDSKGKPILSMRLVRGTPWDQLIQADRNLPMSELLAHHLPILMHVAQAVAFVHSRGVIHRDLKPSQVMVGKYGEVFLMDWGLACTFEAPNINDTAPTPIRGIAPNVNSAPNPAGTVAYMAPEQTLPTAEYIGPATDVYLLGGMLYFLLTGTPPHNSGNSEQAFRHAAIGKVEPPDQRAPGLSIPPELSKLCMEAMRPTASERTQSAQAFCKQIDDYLTGATRRAESKALTDQAEECRFRCGDSYEEMQNCDRILTRALLLAPDNERAMHLRQQLLQRFVELAITNRDLILARAQANRILDEGLRQQLLEKVGTAKSNLQRELRQRRAAFIAIGVLLAILFALISLVFHFRVREAQMEAEKELNRHLTESFRVTNAERQLANTLLARYPVPRSLELLGPDSDATQLRQERAELRRARTVLKQDSIPIQPEPYELALGEAALALHTAESEGQFLQAYDKFEAANGMLPQLGLLSRSQGLEPIFGMGIAAAHAGRLTSATQHLMLAAYQASQPNGVPERVAELIADVQQMRDQSCPIGPDDVIVESRREGKNYDQYREIGGRWIDSGTMFLSKSAVPGLTSASLCGTRKYQFTGPENNVWPTGAAARFHLKTQQPRSCSVYVTWPIAANAKHVEYVVRHASGETTLSLSQNGWPVDGGNSNLWIPLGTFFFNAGDDQYVELRAPMDAKPAFPDERGQVFADAVLFAAKPLPAHEVSPAATK